MKASYWARRAHKWIALVIGVQALLWMISGLYMATISIDIIHGDHLAGAPDTTLQAGVGVDALRERYPALHAFKLKSLAGRSVYEVRHGNAVALVDALSGEALPPLDAEAATKLAAALYSGDGAVRDVRLLEQAPQEVSTRPVPLWRVEFDDRGATTFYLSPQTGELLARRHSLWRIYDFLWMFHIMDYEDRSDVNNRLLSVAAASGLVFALSGIWLLLYSFRRSGAEAA